jgi:CHAD domain-containing protein
MLTDEQADPAEAVHEARKDMKKLRSVLRLVRPVIGDSVYRQENRRFRDAGRILSDARDAKVRSTTLEQLSERFRDDPPPGGWFETIASIDGVAEVDVDEVRIHAAQMIEEGEHKIDEWPLGRDDISLLEAAYAKPTAVVDEASEPRCAIRATSRCTNGVNAPKTTGTTYASSATAGSRSCERPPRRPSNCPIFLVMTTTSPFYAPR